jgi:hypothetical protein
MTTGTIHIDVTRRDSGCGAPELASVRLIVMLPPDWQPRPAIQPEGFRLQLAPGPAEAEVRRVVSEAFADPALDGWQWAISTR